MAEGHKSVDYPGLCYQPDNGIARGRLRQSVQRVLRAQFGRPSGLWGDIAGRIMAHTPSNRERMAWTISLLELDPRDRVLEVGFGPGMAIEQVSGIVTEGLTVGVDHSEVMVRQASRRNARAIREGKVLLLLGSASELPKLTGQFDKIFSINSIHFWNQPVECLRNLRGLLRPGGRLAITIQPRSRGATLQTTRALGNEILADLERAGFTDFRLEVRNASPVPVACALAAR